MTIASKTELLQMRFVSRGQPFCNIGAKTSIDALGTMDFYRQGAPFSGVSNEITPPVYTYPAMPVRRGTAFRITALRQIRYGGVDKGQPIFSQLPNPTYTPYAAMPVRRGTAFKWATAKNTIDASSDYVIQGQPFYVYYGAAPVVFNATRFFLVF